MTSRLHLEPSRRRRAQLRWMHHKANYGAQRRAGLGPLSAAIITRRYWLNARPWKRQEER